MHRNAGHHQRNAEAVARTGNLRQHQGRDSVVAADLERIIDPIILWAMTNTAIVQSSPVRPRPPPIVPPA